MSEFRESVLSRPARITGVLVGAVTLAAGGVAVFRTDNALGSTSLVAAGLVIGALAVFGNHLKAIRAGGVELELVRAAEEARERAELARSSGDVRQAERLERHADTLLAAVGPIAARYERLRATEPSGWDRTARQEAELRTARALELGSLTAAQVAELFRTGEEGKRVVALALIEADPRLATADVLLEAITSSRSTFEQYHGLVAAEKSVGLLPPADRDRLREGIGAVLAGPLGEASSDRRTVARRVLEELSQP